MKHQLTVTEPRNGQLEQGWKRKNPAHCSLLHQWLFMAENDPELGAACVKVVCLLDSSFFCCHGNISFFPPPLLGGYEYYLRILWSDAPFTAPAALNYLVGWDREMGSSIFTFLWQQFLWSQTAPKSWCYLFEHPQSFRGHYYDQKHFLQLVLSSAELVLASSSGLEIPEWKLLGIYGMDELKLLQLISLPNWKSTSIFLCHFSSKIIRNECFELHRNHLTHPVKLC